jgi:protein-S-isoprenylcysteine O-methyltransferase Ste14
MLGVHFTMEVAMVYTSALIAIGTTLILVGWVTLYTNHKKSPFVSNGIYRFSRHPQYVGFILIIVGWLIDWPTLITLVFAPILVAIYLRVCVVEEKEMLRAYPQYEEYRVNVPLLI